MATLKSLKNAASIEMMRKKYLSNSTQQTIENKKKLSRCYSAFSCSRACMFKICPSFNLHNHIYSALLSFSFLVWFCCFLVVCLFLQQKNHLGPNSSRSDKMRYNLLQDGGILTWFIKLVNHLNTCQSGLMKSIPLVF